jgi:AraC-like DNA-binding protein
MHLIPSFTLSSYYCEKHIEICYVHFTDQLQGGLSIYEVLPFHYQLDGVGMYAPQLMKHLLELNPNRGLIETDPAKYDEHDLMPQLDNSDINAKASGLIETDGILLQLFSRFIKDPDDTEHRRLLTQHRFRDVIHYIDEHLDQQISLSELAGIVCLAPDYFSRLFCQIMGIRPTEYVNRKRIEKAQILLTTTNESVSEVARQVGFASLPYFHRVFLKYMHSTPGEHHKAHRVSSV